jgi:hypothetical protein
MLDNQFNALLAKLGETWIAVACGIQHEILMRRFDHVETEGQLRERDFAESAYKTVPPFDISMS